MSSPTDTQLRDEIRTLTHRVDALLAIVTPIYTRSVSIAQQAKQAGVSRTTLWRRRQKAKLQLALSGATHRTRSRAA